VLATLASKTSSTWNDNRLLALLAEHPNADSQVLALVLDRVQDLLATTGARPYAAALALAARAELDQHAIHTLANAPGASKRLRQGLRHALHSRTD
jgi:hypothetical protein